MGKKKMAKLARRAQKARADSMQRHVLVCTAGDCDSSGATTKRMRKQVNGRHLRNTVTVTSADCLGICKSGPICVVYPEGAWYHSVDSEIADRIVAEHLADGQLVESHLFLRNTLG